MDPDHTEEGIGRYIPKIYAPLIYICPTEVVVRLSMTMMIMEIQDTEAAIQYPLEGIEIEGGAR